MSCSPFFRKFPNSVLHQKENKTQQTSKCERSNTEDGIVSGSMGPIQEVLD